MPGLGVVKILHTFCGITYHLNIATVPERHKYRKYTTNPNRDSTVPITTHRDRPENWNWTEKYLFLLLRQQLASYILDNRGLLTPHNKSGSNYIITPHHISFGGIWWCFSMTFGWVI